MAEQLHDAAIPPEATIYPEQVADWLVADRPAPPALAGLIEVERRLAEAADQIDYAAPAWETEAQRALHDAVDELRQVVATIAGSMGLL